MARLPTAWLRPKSTDPRDLVNRNDERGWLYDRLADYLDEDTDGARILVCGDRGLGKSILTRAVVEEFAYKHSDRVVAVIVNGRGIGYRSFLNDLARGIVESVMPHARRWKNATARQWIEELKLLAGTNEITQTQSESIARKYAVEGTAQVDALIARLGTKFSWDETASRGNGIQRTLVVSDDVLLEATIATLWHLRKQRPRVTVVAFYDDLDQAFTEYDNNTVSAQIQRVLEIQPCLALAHIRTEMLSANVRRVIDKQMDVKPLKLEELCLALEQRVKAAKHSAVHQAFREEAAFVPFEQLARLTGNALAFLCWCDAFIDLWGVSPPKDWQSRANLLLLVRRATATGDIDDRVLCDLAELVDSCTCLDAEGCTWDALVKPPSGVPKLKVTELERLKSLGLLVRRNQFDERPVWRLEPQLDLLRPSISRKLVK